jgi:hypothetical protein
MQPHSIRMKLCDPPIDAFDLRWVFRRTQQLAMQLNPFVNFYARLAHALTNTARRLWFQFATIDRDLLHHSAKRDHD